MDADFARIARLPFGPGEGPFRIKGVGYRGHLQYVGETVGLDAMLAGMDPDHAAYFDQPFLAATYYDLLPLLHAAAALARIEGRAFLDFAWHRTQHQARSDLNGVYRAMLRIASAKAVARRFARMSAQYFDFGQAELEGEDGAKEVRGVWRGLPEPLAPWLLATVDSYGRYVVGCAGGHQAGVEETGRRRSGQEAGVPLVDLGFRVHWR
jgi:hypothetical protein